VTAGSQQPGPDFRLLFESIPIPILVLDSGLVMIAMTDAYLAVSGSGRGDLLGHTPMDVFPDNPDDPAASGVANLTQSLRTVLATGRPDTMALQRYDVRAGPSGPFEQRYWSPVNFPVPGDDGSVGYIIHRVEEVTDYVRLRGADDDTTAELRTRAGRLEADLIARAREVQDTNRRLREVNDELATATGALRDQQQAKDRFIATLSHELRTPLAAIRAAIDLLALDTLPGHPALDVLDRQVGALVRMTDDLLDSSRALTGRLTLVREPLDLREVTRSVTSDLRPEFARSDRALLVTVPGDPVPVNGDRVRLAQLLGNLLSNAYAHTRPGGKVAVTVTTEAGEAVLAVRDDGAGFDPASAEGLFEVFARSLPAGAAGLGAEPVGAAGTDAGLGGAARGGLGLGLGLVRSIAELHGGSVSARSEGPGTGAEFRVRLPVTASGRAGSEPRTSPEPRTHGPISTLLIEDSADLAASYRVLLERRGDRVTVARTGREGLALAMMHPFDLVLCDIGLPDVDGHEVARRLRRHPRRDQMRLIAVSGFSQEADRQRSLQAGFDAHLVKPMALADLDAALAGWAHG
jgi:signal transduction histidine kinase